MVHGRSNDGHCTFTCLTFDFGGRWRFFSPLFLASQRPDQETSSELVGPSPPQCNHERACTEDTCFDSTNVCPSSPSPVNLVKGSHDTCHQDRQLSNNSSSLDSCNHSIPGGFVCDPASSKSDTRVFTDRLEDASDVTKEAARSSTKNARRKRKKKKKSSTSSNALVPEVCQSNCYINSCEDGSFSIVEEIAANAGSNTALSRTSSSILGTLFITGDNALDGSSPLLGKNEGFNLDLSPTAKCSPSLEKEGTASLDSVTNPDSQSIAVGDNAGDLHKKMSDTCDSLCSKVLQDLTDVKISRQEGRSSDISLPASKRKNRKGKKLQRSLQQVANLDKEVHLHKPVNGCAEHVSPGLVGGKEIQSLRRDTCDTSVEPEGSYDELHKSNVTAEYLHIVPQCYLASNLSQKITISNSCVNRMFDVVRETYMYQIESEAVHLATGGSLAAFEDFLHEATPVVGLLRNCQHCVTCEDKKMIGNSLCMHKIPNTPLRKFWRWYDKVGSYGIEVKVEEGVQSGNRIGSKVESYSAYFAPLLSAVQLFGHSKYRACTNINRVLKRGSPSSGIPFPQHTKDHNNLSSTSSASAFHYSGGPELLFEFFEVEPPHQRPPIHNKIKELARGESSMNCQMYGDPSKLRNLRLRSVHPSSWYAVAWYPIYRMADSDFRAAFLTYHSFGHFIHTAASSDTLYGDTCIACPVAGLQYYNTQRECWFDLRASSSVIRPTGGDPIKPRDVLKRRLQTLNASATVMSRASLLNGEQMTINRHPDYEFFLSRRW